MSEGAGQARGLGADGPFKPQVKELAFLVKVGLDPWECLPLVGMQNFGEVSVLVIPIFGATGWMFVSPQQKIYL